MTNTAVKIDAPRVVHVVGADPVLGAIVERALAGTPHVVRRQAKLPAAVPPEVVVLDLPAGKDLEALPADVATVVVGDLDVQAMVNLLAGTPHLAHFVGRAGPFFPRILATTLGQLTEPAPWAFARYLRPGASIETSGVTETGAKQLCVDRIARTAAATGAFSELGGLVATVALELLTNALFNAPYDFETHKRRYEDRPRQAPLTLAPSEAATVAFGHDDEMMAIGVRDNFGSLSRSTLMANLDRAARIGERQVRMQTQGAGVGLYMALNATTALDIRVEPRVATEITARFALTKRYRDFEQLGRSLNFFFPVKGGIP